MSKSKMNVTNDEIIDFLEQRMQSDSASEAEEALYIDYHNHGFKVFKWEEHKSIVNRVIRSVKREYGLL